jgi:hypothetical protein
MSAVRGSGRAGTIALVALLPVLVACRGDAGVGPDGELGLSGEYSLEEWFQVAGSDTIRLVEGSYLKLRFRGDRVEGEGMIARSFWMTQDGVPTYRTLPLFGRVDESGLLSPLDVSGWYYLADGDGRKRLILRLRRSEGADTWLEQLDWRVEPDRRSWSAEIDSGYEQLRIVYRKH